jgi:hypothetical protein
MMKITMTLAIILGFLAILAVPVLHGFDCDGIACASDCGLEVCDQAVVAVELIPLPAVSELACDAYSSRVPVPPIYSIDRPPKLSF